MTARDLCALVALAESRRSRDLARLEGLIAEARRLEEEITALARLHAEDVAAEPAPLALLGRRLAWADAEIAARRRRVAALAVELAGVRAAARVSVGKHEALLTLHARAAREEGKAAERAAEIAAIAARAAHRR